jgi:hypothetical protein
VALEQRYTHMADATARIVIQNALFWGRKRLSALTVPWCTYTDPEIAHVGIYVEEACKQSLSFPMKTFTIPISDVDRAVLDGEDEGFVKIHVREGTDTILGATIVARHAGEMINEISLAMVAGIGLKTVAQVIHSYPTQAEAIRKAGDAYNRTRPHALPEDDHEPLARVVDGAGWHDDAERDGRFRRAGVLRATGISPTRRSFPPAGDGAARSPRRPGRRRGEVRLDGRAAARASPRQRDAARRARAGGVREAGGPAPLRGRRLPRGRDVRGAARRARRRACIRRTTWRPPQHVHDRRRRPRPCGATHGARVIVEKPFGRDLASARTLNATLCAAFAEDDIFDRPLLGKGVQKLALFRPTPFSSRSGTTTSTRQVRGELG